MSIFVKKGLLFVAFTLAIVLISPENSFAQSTRSAVAKIKHVRSGWGSDTFSIILEESSVKNPANCSTPDGYLITSDTGGYKIHVATALLANATGKKVEVVIKDGACLHNRPVILGLTTFD